MLIFQVPKLIRRYLLLSSPEQACELTEPAYEGPLRIPDTVPVENYTFRLGLHAPKRDGFEP
jgi:hypothetical protein